MHRLLGLAVALAAVLLGFNAPLARAGSDDLKAEVWVDALDGSFSVPPKTSKASLAKREVLPAPASLRWLILRCAFPDSPPFAHSAARTRLIFEMPDVGVFAFYDRQAQGKMPQSIAAVVEATLPKPREYYRTLPISTFISETTDDCLQVARSSGALVDVAFDALAVFYNDALDCCAYGGQYPIHSGSEARAPAMWVPPVAAESPAIVAHELGHSLGLPHSNNSDEDFDDTDNYWELMSQPTWNAVFERTDWLGFLPKALHARQRWQLGWLDDEQVSEVDVTAGDDRTESFELLHGELVRILRSDGRELVVSFQDAVGPDAGLREVPAVFINTWDPARPLQYPLWVVDAAVPTPSIANTHTSYFTTGESWTLHESEGLRDITVEVERTSAASARVHIHLGPPPQVFASGFEPTVGAQQ